MSQLRGIQIDKEGKSQAQDPVCVRAKGCSCLCISICVADMHKRADGGVGMHKVGGSICMFATCKVYASPCHAYFSLRVVCLHRFLCMDVHRKRASYTFLKTQLCLDGHPMPTNNSNSVVTELW